MKSLDANRLARETFVARVEHYPVLGSTNDRAKQCALGPHGPLPLLIVADEQTAGRGRGTNRWWSGRGSLAFSLLLDGKALGLELSHGPLVALAAAVAVSEVAAAIVPGHITGIHWPNDVFVAGRKLAGILVETLPDGHCVVGIGVNLNNTIQEGPAELQSVAVSLVELIGRPLDATETLIAVLQRFASLLSHLPRTPDHISQIADALCLQRGKTLTIESAGAINRGLCLGIAPDGALLLETATGQERIISGVVRSA